MKIFITGASGLVGSRISELLQEQHIITAPEHSRVNILKYDNLRTSLAAQSPDILVHSAAYTDVSQAELDRDNKNGLPWQLNVEGTRNVVKACKEQNIFLVYISTDAVFSGNKNNPGPYDEYAPIEKNPQVLSWYGWTKAKGERIVAQSLEHYAIVRISNPVRGYYALKKDYIQKILSLYDKKKLYPMFRDQYLTLTYIDEVAYALDVIARNRRSGIFHVSSSDLFTPAELAQYVIGRTFGQAVGIIATSSMNELIARTGNVARYPQYGGLSIKRTQKRLKIKFLTWKETVNRVITLSEDME